MFGGSTSDPLYNIVSDVPSHQHALKALSTQQTFSAGSMPGQCWQPLGRYLTSITSVSDGIGLLLKAMTNSETTEVFKW